MTNVNSNPLPHISPSLDMAPKTEPPAFLTPHKDNRPPKDQNCPNEEMPFTRITSIHLLTNPNIPIPGF
ncbi:hypothetical protein SOVF_117370 [Spinacia oleracea]|nr:hypothetical protein SOVF_117370 [Spinacia oleracea]